MVREMLDTSSWIAVHEHKKLLRYKKYSIYLENIKISFRNQITILIKALILEPWNGTIKGPTVSKKFIFEIFMILPFVSNCVCGSVV